MICTTFVPSWRGSPLPEVLHDQLRWRLRVSFLLVDLMAMLHHGRSFRLLSVCQREALLAAMLAHRWALIRFHARWWKQLALLTA